MINQIVNDLFFLAEFALIRSTNVNSLTELNRGVQHWYPPHHVAARNEIAIFSKLHYCKKIGRIGCAGPWFSTLPPAFIHCIDHPWQIR
jgi:hypothetical protein